MELVVNNTHTETPAQCGALLLHKLLCTAGCAAPRCVEAAPDATGAAQPFIRDSANRGVLGAAAGPEAAVHRDSQAAFASPGDPGWASVASSLSIPIIYIYDVT